MRKFFIYTNAPELLLQIEQEVLAKHNCSLEADYEIHVFDADTQKLITVLSTKKTELN